MMNSRAMVYAVFAVAVGYLLISAVPGELSLMVGPSVRAAGGEEMLGGGELVTAPPPGGEPPGTLEEAPEMQGESADSTKSPTEAMRGAGWLDPTTYGYFFVDLLIALGVYMVAKRHFA